MRRFRRFRRRLFRFTLLTMAIILAIAVIKTITFTSRQIPVEPLLKIPVEDAVGNHLAEAVHYATVSYPGRIDTLAFIGLDTFLRQQFPLADSLLESRMINGFSRIYKWPGRNPKLAPILLLAHQDVVPVDEANEQEWSFPPFGNKVEDGYIWGRGTMDMKGMLMGILEAIEQLLHEGYEPNRTIYLAFGHDEETLGEHGAQQIARAFQAEGLQFEFILDEGMMVIEDAMSGLSRPVAMIGVAEKGYTTLELTARVEEAGHSSRPPKETAIGRLSRAIVRLEQNPFPARIDGATRSLFNYVGPEMNLFYKALFANLWLTEGLVKRQLSADPSTNTVIRTTTAPTLINGGFKDNVLPSMATAMVNFRILPGETVESVVSYVQEVIDDPHVSVRPSPESTSEDPSPVSGTRAFGFEVIQRTAQEIYPDAVVAPALFVALTDSRHYRELSAQAFRFSPMRIQRADLPRIHGPNERLSVEAYKDMIRFYRRLIENSCK